MSTVFTMNKSQCEDILYWAYQISDSQVRDWFSDWIVEFLENNIETPCTAQSTLKNAFERYSKQEKKFHKTYAEFPLFLGTIPDSFKQLSEESWHNDECPSFGLMYHQDGTPAVQVFVDHDGDLEQHETLYSVVVYDDGGRYLYSQDFFTNEQIEEAIKTLKTLNRIPTGEELRGINK